jgi:hypothetical protein
VFRALSTVRLGALDRRTGTDGGEGGGIAIGAGGGGGGGGGGAIGAGGGGGGGERLAHPVKPATASRKISIKRIDILGISPGTAPACPTPKS